MRRRVAHAPDWGRDRARWAELIREVHGAAAEPSAARMRRLADLALAARDCWTPAAPYPDGLMCPLLATAALAWARSADGAGRAWLGRVMIEAAGEVDAVMAAAGVAEAMAVAPTAEPSQGRLPYRDDA